MRKIKSWLHPEEPEEPVRAERGKPGPVAGTGPVAAVQNVPAPQVRKSADASGDFEYDPAPEYENQYAGRIDEATQALENYPDFSYDYESDPAYQAYAKQYARDASRAAQDVLGKYAALTGGVPSSAALAAAQQAENEYGARMADKIPALYDLALEVYESGYDRQRQALQDLLSAEGRDYSRYKDRLSQYNTDRSFAYRLYDDELDRAYRAERDSLTDAQAAEKSAYERALTRAKTLAAYGDFSGYAALGFTQDEIDRMAAVWAEQNASRGRYYYGSGGSGSSSGSVSTGSAAGDSLAGELQKSPAASAQSSSTGNAGGIPDWIRRLARDYQEKYPTRYRDEARVDAFLTGLGLSEQEKRWFMSLLA